ncbi:MAG: hypothetical protein H6Q68_3420 [Firmicutes bacterium]|nr:hypothetical protein [Bacillota bacterium]
MYAIIQGVPVFADSVLSKEKIQEIALDLIVTWTWEGRTIGKIELVCDEKGIHACMYEKACSKHIPWKNDHGEE